MKLLLVFALFLAVSAKSPLKAKKAPELGIFQKLVTPEHIDYEDDCVECTCYFGLRDFDFDCDCDITEESTEEDGVQGVQGLKKKILDKDTPEALGSNKDTPEALRSSVPGPATDDDRVHCSCYFCYDDFDFDCECDREGMPGGYSRCDDEEQIAADALVDQFEDEIQAELTAQGGGNFSTYTEIRCWNQVVAGANYDIAYENVDEGLVNIQIFVPLPGQGDAELTSVKFIAREIPGGYDQCDEEQEIAADALVDQLEEDIQAELTAQGGGDFSTYTEIRCWSQVVAGMNYDVLYENTDEGLLNVRMYAPLPGEGDAELTSVRFIAKPDGGGNLGGDAGKLGGKILP